MIEVFLTLGQLFLLLGTLIVQILNLILQWSLILVWLAVALLAINWKNIWPTLAKGAWLPGVLLIIIASIVWASIAPSSCNCLGFMTVGNFWWQLGAVSLIATVTLLCGWLQGLLNWTPGEISFDPPPAEDEFGHHH